MYKTVPINLVGGSNPNRTRAISQERTLNMYPEPVPSGAYPSVLLPWPGSKTLSDGAGSGTPRGMHTHAQTGVVYKVTDTTLYSMDSDGTETSIGTIAGSGLVIFDDQYDNTGTIGAKLLITTTTEGYIYDITAGTLTQVTDSDYVAGGSVISIQQLAVWQLDLNRFAVGDGGDPGTIQNENISAALVASDNLVRIARFREGVYMMGSTTVEPYYIGTTGTGNPLVAIQNGTMAIGLIDRGCVDSNDDFLYWIGDDKRLHRTSAYDPQSVTPPAIHNDLSKLDFTGARVRCITRDGQNFVQIFTSTKTWCYSETTNEWFELAYKAGEEIALAYDYTYAYNKHLIMSRIDSKILELDEDTYTENGQTIIRERITAPINASALGKNGGRLIAKRAELIIESGVGNLTAPNPLIMISHSIDGGQSFSNEQWIEAGRDGENNLRVEYYFMASFRQIQFKIRTSDPNFFTFHSMALDVKPGGNF